MKTVTIYDVADALGLSVATVNRAFSENGRISQTTKELVLKTAAEMGYRANRAAQALRRNPITIGVLLCCPVKNFADEILRGIQDALYGLSQFNIFSDIVCFTGNAADHKAAVLETLRKFEKEEVGGMVLFLSGDSRAFEGEVTRLSGNIPIAFVGTDPGFARVLQVTVDGGCAGNLAVELLGMCRPSPRLAILAANRNIDVHMSYILGAQWFASANGYPTPAVFEHFDDPDKVTEIAEKISREGGFDGIYFTSSVTLPSEELAMRLCNKGIAMVATDLSEMNLHLLKKHLINAVIYQDPYLQGKTVINRLYDYLTRKEANSVSIKPSLLFSSNAENHRKQ